MAQIRPLAPELAAVAAAELNEVESRIAGDIVELRQWIEEQPYLTTRTDDQFLVGFLRFCKYNMDDTKKRIEYYYTYKSTAGDFLKSRRIDDKVYGICRAGIFATLPKPVGPGGPRIHFTRMGQIDTSLYTAKDIFRFIMFRSEIEANTDDNWIISGVLEIIDFSKIPYALLRQFEPNLFKKMAAFLEYGVPTNLVGTHIVNASMDAQIILNLVRLVMKQKELLHIHSSLESLHKAIGKEYLPVEYGGTNGTYEEAMTHFEQQLNEFSDYFDEDEKYGVDEKLREIEPAVGTVAAKETPPSPASPPSPKCKSSFNIWNLLSS
ncbi:PREDICTED: clavesin-2 isoform X2 [Rhagoletis zephyria]|uniref:clavesin-2 isoform X2 n=1 Tax=Rhagoletis zephyria TaxID=28612 RepID=UPI0008114364|nr:PREDICTED: clavesin-2 isoform X2 [Rhagoletis zephyria]